MVKRLVCFTILFCFLLTSGCSQVETPLIFERYSIVEEEGTWYLKMDPVELPKENPVGPYPQFSAVKEMREKLVAGKIEDDVLDFMQQFYCKNGSMEICDLNNLYEFKTPNDVTVETIYLGYGGRHYWGKMKSDICILTMDCCSKEMYEDTLSYEDDSTPWKRNTITSVENIEDRNATQYLYHSNKANFKALKYNIQTHEKKISVIEKYVLQTVYDDQFVSETIPYSMDIFVEENGAFSHVSVYNLKQRPTIKWIKSFGLVPC